jgi:hypothetical protein
VARTLLNVTVEGTSMRTSAWPSLTISGLVESTRTCNWLPTGYAAADETNSATLNRKNPDDGLCMISPGNF